MERRQFLALGVTATGAALVSKVLGTTTVFAADAKAKGPTITEKDILREGKPANVPNYCENPEKSTKTCPDYKTKPGKCKACALYNITGDTETQFKGNTYGKCALQSEAPQYVSVKGYCSSWNQKS